MDGIGIQFIRGRFMSFIEIFYRRKGNKYGLFIGERGSINGIGSSKSKTS